MPVLGLGARAVARERGESREEKVGKVAGSKLGSFRIFAANRVCLIGIAFGDGVLAGPSALGRCASLRNPPLGMTHGGGNWVRFLKAAFSI